MIDFCDFAVGLSRQLSGLSVPSERPSHRMFEQWHPLGVVGIIGAFNFPVAVWSWNTALAWVCGDVCVWKPSEKTPLTGIACQKIAAREFKENGLPEGISSLITDRKSTRLNSSHVAISYAVFCLKKKKKHKNNRNHLIVQTKIR